MKKYLTKTKIITYTLTMILISVLLCFLGVRDNIEINSVRAHNELTPLSYSSVREVEREDAPLGVAKEFTLYIDDVVHDTNLAFNTSHCYAEVYLEGELLYSMKPSEEIKPVETPGGMWNTIPLCHEDSGREYTVVLLPVYEEFLDQEPEFVLGSVNAIFIMQMSNNFSEAIVTLLVMIVGVLLVGLGMLFLFKTKSAMNFVALGNFSLSISLWRFNDFSFTSLLVHDKNVFIYYLSLTMLMITMISLLESVKISFRKSWRRLFDILSIIISVTSIIQLVLQLTGVFDLREMLFVTHLTILASLILISVCLIIQRLRPCEEDKNKFNPAFILIAGIFLDLLLFYIRSSSAGLMFSMAAVLGFVIVEGVRFVVGYIEREEKLVASELKLAHNETVLAESRFITLMSQIRSHFIFNILNAISGMCKYDPEKADKTIVHFARFLRSNIDIMQDDSLVPFHNALRHLEDYVALEQIRFGDNIQFETDFETDNFMIPPLVMQPLVENSIKHGLTPKAEGGTITLRTRKDKHNIYVIIEDDGIGFDSSLQISEKSVGLQNIRFRLAHMVKGTLKIESIVNIGTKATITIPRKESEKCD